MIDVRQGGLYFLNGEYRAMMESMLHVYDDSEERIGLRTNIIQITLLALVWQIQTDMK